MTIHKSSALSVFYLAILLLIMGCASQNNNANTTERPGYRFLSKKEASKWIVIDEKEDFLEK